MNRLVSNGVHLLKRGGHLVRTPIRVTLTSDRRAYYSVAGHYDTNNLPDRGFIAQATYDNTVAMGRECISAYLNHPNALQIWRATSYGQPMTAWYQGAFAPSAPNIQSTFTSCEAYVQLAGYHFTTPESLRGLTPTKVKVKFSNGGAVKAWQSAGMRSSNNTTLRGWSQWGQSWYMPFYVDHTLRHPAEMQRISAWDSNVNILADGGTFTGARDLWMFPGTTRDGGTPCISVAPTKSYEMGDGSRSVLANSGGDGIWIVPDIGGYLSGTSYGPWFHTSDIGWWGCFSVWGIILEVEYS